MASKDKEDILNIVIATLRSYYDNPPDDGETLSTSIYKIADHIADEVFTTPKERKHFVASVTQAGR